MIHLSTQHWFIPCLVLTYMIIFFHFQGIVIQQIQIMPSPVLNFGPGIGNPIYVALPFPLKLVIFVSTSQIGLNEYCVILHCIRFIPSSVAFKPEERSIHPYLDTEFKNMSLAELIDLSRKKQPSVSSYSDLFMVSLLQNSQYKRSLSCRIDPFDIYMVTAFQRNSSAQVYTCPNLQGSLHFAVPEPVAKEIHHRINFFRQSSASKIPITIIPNSQAYFHDSDNSVFVSNMVTSCELSKNSPLQEIKSLLLRSVEKGLLDEIKFVDKGKRGGTPTMSFGFTKSDCRKYPKARNTIFGNVDRIIVEGDFVNLDTVVKGLLFKIIQKIVSLSPNKADTFYIPHDNKERAAYREKFTEPWLDAYKSTFPNDSDLKETVFPFEAFTIICPLVLGDHRDLLNDFVSGMAIVLQFSAMLPIDTLTDNSPLKKWILSTFPGALIFPASLIFYLCRVVRETVARKMIQEDFASNTSPLSGVNIGPLRKAVYSVMLDVCGSRNYQRTFEQSTTTSHEMVRASIEHFNKRQNTFIDLFLKGSYVDKLFSKSASEEMLASYKFLLPTYLALASSLKRSKTSPIGINRDLIRFSKLLRFVKMEHVPNLTGQCSHTELTKWFCVGVGGLPIVLLRSFSGITRKGRNSNISLFDDIPHHQSPDEKKSMHYPSFNVHSRHLLVAQLLHCARYLAPQKENTTKKSILGGPSSFPRFDYNNPCVDPHQLLPNFSYTFNGPVIRLPASWNREVSYISNVLSMFQV